MAFNAYKSSKENVGGGFGIRGFNLTKYPKIKIFNAKKEKEADYTLVFVPYKITSKQDPNCQRGATVGDTSYNLIYDVHNYVGVGKKTVVCPRNLGKACPICEAYEQAKKEFGFDSKEAKDLKPKKRAIYNVIDMNSKEKDVMIFDEALTSSSDLTKYFPPQKAGHYFVTRGGSLGVGFPGAIGLKIAHPDKTVIGFSGDGGSMYTIQALWSAVRHNIGAKFIVCNNSIYKLLDLNINQYWKENNISSHNIPSCFDLSNPGFRFDQIAQSLGVNSIRVEKPEQIAGAIEKMLADDKPFLIDLVLDSH